MTANRGTELAKPSKLCRGELDWMVTEALEKDRTRRGIEDARGGEPARALHLFVKALRTLPADDPEAAPLERVIRANLAAWAETVPALEHIWRTGARSRTSPSPPTAK